MDAGDFSLDISPIIMSHFWRTTLFFLFLFAFLVSAPLLVLYTAGYRLDLSNGRIVHTAALNISSLPRNASVSIDDTLMPDRTPAVFDRIVPGEHEVKLEKDGYLPWVKKVTFQSKEAVIIQDVVMFLDTQPQVAQTITPIQTSVSPDGKRLAYLTQQSSWIEVWTTDGTLESTKLLIRLPYEVNSDYVLDWSLAGTYLSLARVKNTTTQLTIARAQDGTSAPLDDELSLVDDYWWDVESDNVLFVRIDRNVHQMTIGQSGSKKLAYTAQGVQTFDARDVFWEESNNRVVLSFWDGTTASILTYLPLGDYEFQSAPTGFIALYDTGRNRYILVNAGNREQPILLNEEAISFKWNPSGDALLFTSGYDLKLYRPASHQIQTLTRLSEPIDEIGWYTRGNVALYQVGGRTMAILLNEPAPASEVLLASDAPGAFWLSDDADRLFLLVRTNDGKEIRNRELQK